MIRRKEAELVYEVSISVVNPGSAVLPSKRADDGSGRMDGFLEGGACLYVLWFRAWGDVDHMWLSRSLTVIFLAGSGPTGASTT